MPSADATWSSICDAPPIGYSLKSCLPDRWVRFYSLPEGKRYAETDAEREEVLTRADTLIGEASAVGERLMVVTGLMGESGAEPARTKLMEAVQPQATYWREVAYADEGMDDLPWHLWVSWPVYERRGLDSLIRRAAEWEIVGVLVVATGRRIVIHQYDGGTDVILLTTDERARWRERHRDWASPRTSDL